jgi:hypothetical protein
MVDIKTYPMESLDKPLDEASPFLTTSAKRPNCDSDISEIRSEEDDIRLLNASMGCSGAQSDDIDEALLKSNETASRWRRKRPSYKARAKAKRAAAVQEQRNATAADRQEYERNVKDVVTLASVPVVFAAVLDSISFSVLVAISFFIALVLLLIYL